MKSLLKIFVLYIAFLYTLLDAHQSALSYLKVTAGENGRLDLQIQKPLADLGKDDLKIIYPGSCYEISLQQEQKKGYLITRKTLLCTQKALSNEQIRITNLAEQDAGVIVDVYTPSFSHEKVLLTASNPFISLKGEAKPKGFLAFIQLGTEHILQGYDHLLFVLSLLLLVQNWKRLVWTVSAFTVAHSLTLGLAALGMVAFSIPYIEALIALSIVFLVREILTGDGSTLTYRYPWSIAFLFGLVHGFGFAAALDQTGIRLENFYSTLFLFNLGVELGQILFILLIWISTYLLYKQLDKYADKIKKMTLYLIGIIASYWFLQRLFVLI